MRANELPGLPWFDMDLDENTIPVRRPACRQRRA
jgi:hypothetical protein